MKKTEPRHRPLCARLIATDQITLLPYVASGIVVFASGFNGLYWMGLAMIASFPMAALDAWVLLAEINR
ncbi:MAG TPA: hypothetical protein VMF88_00640 [Bacteroidota bacterium]|nr:hypothetical protein [Bacteroidota bacterium]